MPKVCPSVEFDNLILARRQETTVFCAAFPDYGDFVSVIIRTFPLNLYLLLDLGGCQLLALPISLDNKFGKT